MMVWNEICPMRVEARMNRFPIRCCLYSGLSFFYQNIQEGKRVAALQFFGKSDVIMYVVEGIKENVQSTHVVESNNYIIYIAPKDDWIVLNVNFCESLIYYVVHYYVGMDEPIATPSICL